MPMTTLEHSEPRWYAERLDKMTDKQLLSEIRAVMDMPSSRRPGADLHVFEVLAEGLINKSK